MNIYHSPASAPRNAPGATESTTARSAVLKQIRALQKLEAGMGKELAELQGDMSVGVMQKRMALQQQMNGVKQQIQLLQTALLREDADRTVQVSKTEELPAATDGGTGARAAAGAATGADPGRNDAATTVGSVIDTHA